jgi:tRNA(Ile)-lysidine synthase
MQQLIQTLKDECGYSDGDSVLVACSGGADSVALLVALHEHGIPLAVAHVNYNLRGAESIEDEMYVAALCSQLDVPYYVRQSSKEELNSLSANTQEAARKVRYEFFYTVATGEQISLIATAHHLDDQLETVLMNFLRGSGINGLSGMKFREGKLIRPFLNETGDGLRKYLIEKNISWRTDSSNNTDAYLRNRIRHHVIPELKQCDERNGKGWQTSVRNLNETEILLQELCRVHAEQIVRTDSNGIHFRKSVLKHAPSSHLLFNFLLREEGFEYHFSPAEFHSLFEQQAGKKYISNGLTLHVDREEFVLTSEDKTATGFTLQNGEEVNSEWSCFTVKGKDPALFREYETLLNVDLNTGKLTVRAWQEGDKIRPVGFKGTKKVSDILNEIKVPSHLKKKYPVVIYNDEIAWIPGYRIAEKFKVNDIHANAVYLKWKN